MTMFATRENSTVLNCRQSTLSKKTMGMVWQGMDYTWPICGNGMGRQVMIIYGTDVGSNFRICMLWEIYGKLYLHFIRHDVNFVAELFCLLKFITYFTIIILLLLLLDLSCWSCDQLSLGCTRGLVLIN